jgi:hypothetical protein
LRVWGPPNFSTYRFTLPLSSGSMYELIRLISSAEFPISFLSLADKATSMHLWIVTDTMQKDFSA